MTIEPHDPNPPRTPSPEDPSPVGGAWPSATSWIADAVILVIIFAVFIKQG